MNAVVNYSTWPSLNLTELSALVIFLTGKRHLVVLKAFYFFKLQDDGNI